MYRFRELVQAVATAALHTALRTGMAAFVVLFVAACQPVVMPVTDIPGPTITETADAAEVPATTVPEPEIPEPGQAKGSESQVDPEMIEKGMAVYRAQYCGICHELTAAGTTGRFGPPHDGIGIRAEERVQNPGYSGSASSAEEYVYESLVQPQAYTVEGYVSSSHPMPPYTHLSEEDLRALVALLLAQQ